MSEHSDTTLSGVETKPESQRGLEWVDAEWRSIGWRVGVPLSDLDQRRINYLEYLLHGWIDTL
jgi:hypothetical protein